MTANLSQRMAAAGVLGLAALALGPAAWAHHEIAGKFDMKSSMELTGVITKVDWRNPHVHLLINVTQGGQTLNWAVEMESPSILEMDGWRKGDLEPGETVVVKGPRARDGSRQVWGADVRYKDNLTEVFPAKLAISRSPLAPRPAPRWPDGHAALGAIPGGSDGFWTDPSKTAMVENGVVVGMDEWGLLNNIEDAAKVAPMQPWALELYKHRQSRELRDDPMYLNCKPPGGPRQYQSKLGFQLIEDRERQRVFVLMGSGNHNYRIIYTDARQQVGQVGGDDDNPLYFGRSDGKWDGDTFVVDTLGFNEDFWFTNGGLPHTSLLHLTERFTRTDMDTLRYEVQVNDPGAYTRNWSASWTLRWNGGATLPSHFCQNNRP